MQLLRDRNWRFPERSDLNLIAIVVIYLATAAPLAAQGVLEFLAPTNNALFSTRDEIPIVLRAVASNDVFLTGEVFANNQKIADVSYCCSFCPCARPQLGMETTLQIPVPPKNGNPPSRPWQGWTNVSARTYQLTARSTGENGTTVQAAPVTITVFDRSLHIGLQSDGTVILVIPQGSMTLGSYDLEASEDLRTWNRLGPFQPGNVAAFYWDEPPKGTQQRFYRSVYIPHSNP